MALEVLRGVLASDYKGPRAVFSEVHVLKAVMSIGASGSVGRGRLGNLLGLGQGEVRTLIKRMKAKGLIRIEANGCSLSAKGLREFRKLRDVLPWSSLVKAEELGIGKHCWALLVRDAAPRVRLGLEQRDAAVRGGANGALTAVFKSGRFTLPGEDTDCEKNGPKTLWSAVREASPTQGDAVVVAGAPDVASAEFGALAAAVTLL